MIPPLIYLDRYRNEGTRIYSPHSDYTEADVRFRPDSRYSSFDLPAFSLPLGEVQIYQANPNPLLLQRHVSGERSLVCIHPQVLNARPDDVYLERVLSAGKPEKPIRVSPSSSTRTLYVHDVLPPHALKVHFPFRVSRYGRRMRAEVIEQAIQVSRDLEQGVSSLEPGFAFQREVLGVAFRNHHRDGFRGENWGYLVRELNPFPAGRTDAPLIPAFSLYGRDFFEPDLPPLVLDLLGDRDPRGFILENVMFPIIRHWVSLFLSFGFMLEPHGQNVLLELDGKGGIQRIVHRDLNLGVDNRRRRDLGLPTGGENTYNQMESGEFASITYDKFMGCHFFEHLMTSLARPFDHLAMEDFQGPCRDHFAEIFPEHREYLPRTVHYFSEERDAFGKPGFLDTGEPPVWRP